MRTDGRRAPRVHNLCVSKRVGVHILCAGRVQVSVQRVGVWHNSWHNYPTINTPNARCTETCTRGYG